MICHCHSVTLYYYCVQEDDDDAVDSHGIPGWDRVDRLARALIGLSGLAITNSQAREIKKLYNDLLPYDKKPLAFEPITRKPSHGRFARSKSGHVGVEQMKR